MARKRLTHPRTIAEAGWTRDDADPMLTPEQIQHKAKRRKERDLAAEATKAMPFSLAEVAGVRLGTCQGSYKEQAGYRFTDFVPNDVVQRVVGKPTYAKAKKLPHLSLRVSLPAMVCQVFWNDNELFQFTWSQVQEVLR